MSRTREGETKQQTSANRQTSANQQTSTVSPLEQTPSRHGLRGETTFSTLVLNATFEPIGVISGRRAVILALSQKVDVLAERNDVIRSERCRIALPSVVRLRYFVKVPYRRQTPVTRKAIFGRDNGRCQYCDQKAENIDHVMPRSRGGRHVWTNVVACCRRCNSTKSNHLLKHTSLKLRSAPRPPADLAWIRVAAGSIPAAWNPYLDLKAA